MPIHLKHHLTGRSGLRERAVFVGSRRLILLLIGILLFGISPVHAARPALPAPLCGLVSERLICYDVQTAAPTLISPEGQHVTDYAFASDGNWLAYRVDSLITLVSVSGAGTPQTLDSAAAPPPTFDPAWTSIVWSPDVMAVAYVTAAGLRVAFPPLKYGDKPQIVNVVDRPYVNLRFSPGGRGLAAQADDGSWNVFDVNYATAALHNTRSIDQASEVAWLDDTSLVVAPLSGGLLRLDSAGDGPPKWTVPGDHFTKLFATSGGQVLATHPDPGDTIGSVVSISADGKVTPLGDSKIDSRVSWGPDGRMMLYITSGTPILVDRATAAEDTLPISGVTQVTWAPPPPRLTTSLPMDGDLYFLAADEAGTSQLWRLVRSGTETATQLTHELYSVLDFAVSPDRSRVALTTGGTLVLASLSPTTPNSASDVVLATLNDSVSGFLSAQADWRPDGKQLAYRDSDGIYLVDVSNLGIPVTPDSAAGQPKGVAARHNPVYQKGAFALPRYSPNGRYLLAQSANASPPQFFLSNLQKKDWQPVVLNNPADHLVWSQGLSLIAYSDLAGSGDLTVLPIAGQDKPQPIFTASDGGPIADAQFVTDTSLGYLQEVGWSAGPDVVQLYTATIPGGEPQAQGVPCAIPGARLSPGGQFAAGIQRVGKIDELVIADLQTCRKFRIQGVEDVVSLTWVR